MSQSEPSISVDALLGQQAWVRAVARALVRDPHEADDLAQDAWVTALRSPPGDPGGVRAWFRRVLKNLDANRFRSDSRRQARESAVARSRTDPSAADIVARAEVHRKVVGLVMDLRNPFREALLLRFFEGLGPSEVAAKTGVPDATARTRIHRGLGMIRSRLDQEHRGDRKAWCVALLPLLGRDRSALAAEMTALTGAFVMGWKLKSFVVAIVLVLGAVGIHSLSAGSPLPEFAPPIAPDDATARAGSGATAPPAPGPNDSPPVRSGEPPRESGETVYSVRVKVTHADGTPGAEATVRLREPFQRSHRFAVLDYLTEGAEEPRVVRRAEGDAPGPGSLLQGRSDVEGEVVLRQVGFPWTRVTAEWNGRTAMSGVLELAPNRTNRVELLLEPSVSLVGIVRTEEGRPIPDAALELSHDAGPAEHLLAETTGRDGRFRIGPVPERYVRDGLTLDARCQGFASGGRGFDRDHPVPDSIEIVLLAEGVVRGRCVGARARPVEGVLVHAVADDSDVFTGPNGQFEIRGLRRRGVLLHFLPKDRGSRLLEFAEIGPEGVDLGDVVLPSGKAIGGRVEDPSGRPVPACAVTLREPARGLIVRRTVTAADGSFLFDRVGTEPRDVRVEAPTRDGSWASGTIVERKGVVPGERHLVVELDGGLSMLVRICDLNGDTITTDQVSVELEPHARPGRRGSQSFVGEELTSVRVRPRVAGAYRVTVRVPGYEPVVYESVEIREAESVEIEAHLRRR